MHQTYCPPKTKSSFAFSESVPAQKNAIPMSLWQPSCELWRWGKVHETNICVIVCWTSSALTSVFASCRRFHCSFRLFSLRAWEKKWSEWTLVWSVPKTTAQPFVTCSASYCSSCRGIPKCFYTYVFSLIDWRWLECRPKPEMCLFPGMLRWPCIAC